MALATLPIEIIEDIIAEVLPEGFESLALSCKRFYRQCAPFIERHNGRRSRFRNFKYGLKWGDHSSSRTASDLITLIAIDPVVAHYIKDANFQRDSVGSLYAKGWQFPREMPIDDEAVSRLFSRSRYLQKAGLDWKDFYTKFREHQPTERTTKARYSQHLAAFLLTLLPNVETLRLPASWNPHGPLDVTNKLVDTIVCETNQPHLHYGTPSLSKLTKLSPSIGYGPDSRFALDWVMPFIALPQLRLFHGPSCVAIGENHLESFSKSTSHEPSETVEQVTFGNSCIDVIGITDFLKKTPKLRVFEYSHLTKDDDAPRDWDICKFVTAIEHELGSNLLRLSITIHGLRGSIIPGKTSMRGLVCLQKLEFPLEIARCNIAANASQIDTQFECHLQRSMVSQKVCGSLFDELVPPSVTHLSIIARGMDQHGHALDLMFCHFADRKKSQSTALRELYLTTSPPRNKEVAYKDVCDRVLAETEQAGVTLHLDTGSSSVTTQWDDDVLWASELNERYQLQHSGIDPARLKAYLHLEIENSTIHIISTRLLIHRYNPMSRYEDGGEEANGPSLGSIQGPPLPLPPVEGIVTGRFYVVREVLFTYSPPKTGNMNWRVFIEIATGSVLYLRAITTIV